MQAQEIGAGHGLRLLGVVRHGLAAGIKFLQRGRIPGSGQIGDFDADLGSVLDGRVKGVERHHILAADDDCLVTGAQGHGIDLAAVRSRLGSESHK